MRLIIFTFFICTYAYGAEIDHFSTLNRPLKNSEKILNNKVNEYLYEAVEMANFWPNDEVSVSQYRQHKKGIIKIYSSAPVSCSDKNAQELLINKMKLFFYNHLKNPVFNFYYKSKEISKASVTVSNSIYQGWSFRNGRLLSGKKAESSGVGIAPVMSFNNTRIGTDKFEHFFGTGHKAYINFYEKGWDFHQMMGKDHFKERTILGGHFLATGIFSFADLVANFNGARFWNHLLQKYDDIMGPEFNIGPYVECEEKSGQWKVVRNNPIDLTFYVDDGWDESINCSMTASQGGARKIKENIQELNRKRNTDYKCPMSQSKFQKVVQKYGEYGAFLLNKYGIRKKSFFSYFNNYGVYEPQFEKRRRKANVGNKSYKTVGQDKFNQRLNKLTGKIERVY